MEHLRRHIDTGSFLVIVVTFALFTVALFVKGLEHDVLLEAGVFLVSVKLVLMAYRSSVAAEASVARLDDIRGRLARLEALLAAQSGTTDGPQAPGAGHGGAA